MKKEKNKKGWKRHVWERKAGRGETHTFMRTRVTYSADPQLSQVTTGYEISHTNTLKKYTLQGNINILHRIFKCSTKFIMCTDNLWVIFEDQKFLDRINGVCIFKYFLKADLTLSLFILQTSDSVWLTVEILMLPCYILFSNLERLPNILQRWYLFSVLKLCTDEIVWNFSWLFAMKFIN